MKTHFSILACILIFCGIGGGCIVLDGKSKEWEEKNIPTDFWGNDPGPGKEDGEFRQRDKQQWEIDTHENIAIGFFPGFARDGGTLIRSKQTDGPVLTAFMVPFMNVLLLGFPTICSAFIEPFNHAQRDTKWAEAVQCSEWGIVGCHRWLDSGYKGNFPPTRHQINSAILEKQLLRRTVNQTVQTASTTLPIPEFGPTTVYMEYPGFGPVRQCVAKEKLAAVVFSTSSQASTKSNAAIKLRCFRPSAYNKQALAYEDISVDGGGVLAGYVRKYRKVKEAGETAVQLKGKDQQIDEVLQPLEKELALLTALQLSDARLSQVESVLGQCRKYLGQVAPVKKRVDDLILKAPEDKRLRQLSNQLEYKIYSSSMAADGIDISKLQDEVAVAERHSAKIGKLTTKAAGLADLVHDDNNIVLLAAQCKALMPCFVSDSELEDLKKQIDSLDGKCSKISKLLDRALPLQNKIPENETLIKIVEELKSARPSAANDERLAAISNDINSITKCVNAIAPLSKKANSILEELPENEELKKVCGQLDLRGKSLPDEAIVSESEKTLLRIESATGKISKMKKRILALKKRFPEDGYLLAAVQKKRELLSSYNAHVPSEAEIGEMESAMANIEADALARESGISHLDADGSWRYESDLLEFAVKFDSSIVEAISIAKKKLGERLKTLKRLNDALSDTGHSAQSDEVYRAAKRQNYAGKCALANVYRKLEIAYVLFKKSEIFPGNARIAKELDAAKEACREAAQALNRKHDSKLKNKGEYQKER